MRVRTVLRFHFLILALPVCILAQNAKRPLAWKDADNWRSIQSQTLSRDGHWLAYGLFPQEGDGEVIVRDLRTGKELRENAGTLPPPPEPDPEELTPREGGPQTMRIRVAFTADGRFLLSSVYPRQAETDQAKKEKKKPEEMPKNGLVVFDLNAGKATRVADVRSFQVPERGPALAAWLKESKAEAPAKPAPAPRGRARPEFGSELVLQDLAQSQTKTFPDVIEFTLTKDGATLVYAVASRKSETNGVFALPAKGEAQPAALLAGKGKYSKLTWDLKQTRLAFLSDRDDADSKPPKARLYLW
ncbi:MAG: hypothetical protein HY822_22120, partial [Acidobacteria bacterium]|nr:hypothetical protein [Acidobacteriota bacterium]